MNAIFLSAGVPGEKSGLISNPVAIREAIIATIKSLPRGYKLVFGGHPAISPLVRYAANRLGRGDDIIIFQSRFFEGQITPDAKQFLNYRWTPKLDDKPTSLAIMRKEMIYAPDLDYQAAVFLGGEKGIKEEFDLYKGRYNANFPDPNIFLVVTTNGMTEKLFDTNQIAYSEEVRDLLSTERHYPKLFRKLFSKI